MTKIIQCEVVQKVEELERCYGFLTCAHSEPPTREFLNKVSNEENYNTFYSFTREDAISSQNRCEMKSGLQSIRTFKKEGNGLRNLELAKIQTYSIERTHLYRRITPGYGPIPPYESVYRGQPIMGGITLEVKNIYKEFDYHLPENNIEPPDWIGYELGFMNHILVQKAKAIREGDLRKIDIYLDLENRFLSKHLLRWVPAFCSEVLYYSNMDLYKGVAQITIAVIFIHAELIGICLSDNGEN